MAEEKRFQTGDIIVAQDSEPDGIYRLKQGSVGIYKDDVLLDVFMGKGSIIGEMSVALNRARTATVKARSGCTVEFFEGNDMYELLQAHPEVAPIIVENLATRLDAANHKIAQFTKDKLWTD